MARPFGQVHGLPPSQRQVHGLPPSQHVVDHGFRNNAVRSSTTWWKPPPTDGASLSNLLSSDADEVDAFMAQQAKAAAPPPPPPPPPMTHFLRNIDTTPRVLHGNIFPFASYINTGRHQYNKQTFESARLAQPCAPPTHTEKHLRSASPPLHRDRF